VWNNRIIPLLKRLLFNNTGGFRELLERIGQLILSLVLISCTYLLSDQAMCLHFIKKSARYDDFSALSCTFQDQNSVVWILGFFKLISSIISQLSAAY